MIPRVKARAVQQRLQKLIAQAGLASRRTAEEWIAAGRVKVNGAIASLGDRADLAVDQVLVDGRPLARAEQKLVVMLNKPSGYVCTLKDPQGRKRVTDLVADLPQRLFPIGRLDYNTEGLLLLTNDGELAQLLSHPRHHVDKTYLVKVRGHLNPQTSKQLTEGVRLADGVTLPARVANVRLQGKNCWFELTIREGRNRQVRRMCEALGLPVSRLKRIRLAFLELGQLPAGRYRPLSAAEIARLRSA